MNGKCLWDFFPIISVIGKIHQYGTRVRSVSIKHISEQDMELAKMKGRTIILC